MYLNDLDGLDRDHFRWLPVLQFLSIGYDTTGPVIVEDVNGEFIQENALASAVKRFSVSLSYVQYGFMVSLLFSIYMRISIHQIDSNFTFFISL